jgi:hypothetical protein
MVNVRVSNSRSHFNVRRLNILVPIGRSCQKKYIYEIWKALSLTIQKIEPMLKFLKSKPNFKFKVRRSKLLVSVERSCHKDTTYEIWKSYHLPYIKYGQCSGFCRQTNRQTDRPKTICPLYFDTGAWNIQCLTLLGKLKRFNISKMFWAVHLVMHFVGN